MEKVKRMIILAAGMGSRLAPLTNDKPKPLVPVNGVPIIVPLIEAALRAGITDIYIVRGYKGEQYDALLEEYPMLHFIDNSDYDKANNLGSIVAAREYLSGSYVVEGDLLLYEPEIIKPEQEESNYLGKYVSHTDDWCFFVDENKVIKRVAIGGDDCYQMVGISYWSEEDGKRLADCALRAYEGERGRELYWDEVALTYFKEEFSIHVHPCREDAVIEIDTYEEWKLLEEELKEKTDGKTKN